MINLPVSLYGVEHMPCYASGQGLDESNSILILRIQSDQLLLLVAIRLLSINFNLDPLIITTLEYVVEGITPHKGSRRGVFILTESLSSY